MRKAALILTYICGFINVIWPFVLGIMALNADSFGLGFFYLSCVVVSGIFTIVATNSILKNNKKTWIGVCDLLFCGLIGGIFYLIWDPNKANSQQAVAKTEDSSCVMENKIQAKEEPVPKESVADQLLQSKDLKDVGAITEEEYEEKRKHLMDKL